MLTLPIKKKWFDMILSGEKKEEYREIKPYYMSRFCGMCRADSHEIRFRNGYSAQSPSFVARCMIEQGYGKPEWGAEEGKKYYVLKILEVKNEGGN